MIILKERFQLDGKSIANVAHECADAYSEKMGKRADPAANVALAVEESLLSLRQAYGEDAFCDALCTTRFGSMKYEFAVQGENKPVFDADDPEMRYSSMLLRALDNAPICEYDQKQGRNVVTYSVGKKPIKNKMWVEILIGVVLAFICWGILAAIGGDTGSTLRDSVISPIFTKLTALIAGIATPLVFFAVVNGITGIGSSSALGSIGKKLLGDMGKMYLFAAVLFTVVPCLYYGISATGAGGGDGIGVTSDIITLVLDMVPNNMFDCFVKDNSLQVIVLAVFVGIVLLRLGSKAEAVTDACETLGNVVNTMMAIVFKLLPLVVFVGILKMLLSDTTGLENMAMVVVLWAVCALVICAAHAAIVKVKFPGVSIVDLLKKQLPTAMINLSTGSQVAAVPETVKCCKEKFGIDGSFVDFGIPLCMVIYMPCVTVQAMSAWGAAQMAGIPIDLFVAIKLAVIATVIAIAAPPVSGAAFAVVPILMGSAGIPLDYFSVVLVVGAVTGHLCTPFNGYCVQLRLLITADKLGKVDREKLLAKA